MAGGIRFARVARRTADLANPTTPSNRAAHGNYDRRPDHPTAMVSHPDEVVNLIACAPAPAGRNPER
jgi:hypothetical protein